MCRQCISPFAVLMGFVHPDETVSVHDRHVHTVTALRHVSSRRQTFDHRHGTTTRACIAVCMFHVPLFRMWTMLLIFPSCGQVSTSFDPGSMAVEVVVRSADTLVCPPRCMLLTEVAFSVLLCV
jgi:hypothetical protein